MKREILSILVMFAVVFVVAGNVNAEGPSDGVQQGPEYYGGDTPQGNGDCERDCERDCDQDCEPQELRKRVRKGVSDDTA